LEAFAKHHNCIKFLTRQVGSGEKQATLTRAISDFKKEYGKDIELRITTSKELHDRYILSKTSFLIVGHGIKDLGSKESIIVFIEDRYGKEIRKTIMANFNVRWNAATLL
jgi:hypothetical protein